MAAVSASVAWLPSPLLYRISCGFNTELQLGPALITRGHLPISRTLNLSHICKDAFSTEALYRMKWKVVKPEIKTSLRRFYYTDPGEIRRNRQWGPASGKRGDLPSLRLWNLIIICNFLLSLITKLQQFHPRNDT
ncbi:uncharacterized protein LOC116574292 isoform X1 [Mustela erminea]|uniref:uncharacterized protein LOC116574292 isoform X1 n=1 Tax=Mustela erminea TaxID=36723 RepID=UPI001386E4E9|nr:uncharacterized protein LOC116574292 isoform X1 [Mustela erminea]